MLDALTPLPKTKLDIKPAAYYVSSIEMGD